MDLQGKAVLVTGSSSGIGQAIAIECAKAGAKVLVHYRKNKNGAEETLKEVEKFSKGKIFRADLTIKQEVEKMFTDIKTLDVLVNNAGEYRAGELDDFDLWKSEFDNIFFSTVFVTNYFLKTNGVNSLRKIVNTSSWYSFLETGVPNGIHYCAAKAALNDFTANLAKKLAPNILVNAVAPGYTWTPPWEGTQQDDLDIVKRNNRIGRFVDPKEIASLVLELIRNDAITGEIIRVDGGAHLPDTF
ncbi:SDR family oxidoreductase [Candidatus Microgenomates bacterium]|nr:SDR family oxidoreductase [Candidatus Microgenomates bacterium]